MNSELEIKLAPPGAGLPKVELFVGRLLFALRRATGNKESYNLRFAQEREAINRILATLDAASAATRILIQRPPGLEDSSRYWSVWMTLDHLRIVHGEFIRVIRALDKGVMPEGTASTAAVKPSPDVNAAVVEEYQKSCDDLLATVAAAGDLKTKLRYAHPWFGPLDAEGWHALSAGHMGIHRAQIKRICAGLEQKREPARNT